MKKLQYILLALSGFLCYACEQELVETTPADPDLTNITPDPCEGSAGSANFAKFVSIGNSFVAGVQAGALFNDGQTNSLPAIMNNQFACVGGSSTFNQPSINSALGFNIFITPNPTPSGAVLGRLLLQGTPPRPTPQISDNGALPNPVVNPAFLYTGSKAELNNFGVQAIVLGQALIPQTGNWAGAGVDPRFNPFYGRLAYPGTGTSTIIGDAAAAGGTFFMFWLGLDDFFLHAAFGADATKAPLTAPGPLPNGFDGQYAAAVGSLLASNPELKGVVGNFPNIFAMPHFTSVTWNPVPLDAATATVVNTSYAGYNQVLDALKGPPFNYAAADVDARKILFAAGNNAVVIVDETLNDYGDEFDILEGAGAISPAQRAALVPYEQVRQTKSTDIMPLGAGAVLGTLADPNNPLTVIGVAVPLADQYVLIPSEIAAIESARTSFNATVKTMADANTSRLAFADVNKAFSDFVTAKAMVSNNITITPNINPPTGIYSEDGAHPNTRGYAFIANVFIGAINERFGSTVPLVNLSKYGATSLPLP